MDKVQFLNAINYGEKHITDMIVNHLDQCMVLYDLVNSSDKITRISDTQASVTFQIDSRSRKDTARILESVSITPAVIKYNNQVDRMTPKVISDKSIVLKMTKTIQQNQNPRW